MDISPWIACLMSIASITLGLGLLCFRPGVDHIKDDTTLPEIQDTDIRKPQTIFQGFRSTLKHKNVVLLIPVFLVGTLRYPTLNVLIPYASIRFNIRISRGAVFYTETAVVNILLFLLIIPATTKCLREHYNMHPATLDRYLVGISLTLLCLGALALALAPSMNILSFAVAIFAAGFGSRVSALSLVSYWIPNDFKATSYAAIAVLENIGHAIGDPSMQFIFASSLKLPKVWMPLPFFVTAASCSFCHTAWRG